MRGAFKIRPGPACLAFRWNFHLACISYWAYHSNPALDNSFIQATGLQNLVYHPSPAPPMPGFIMGHDGTGFQVGIGGTDDVQQLFAYIMRFGLVNGVGITGRTFTPFNDWSDAIADVITPLVDNHTRITLTGHSLGGALAIVTGEKLAARGKEVQCSVTYACPRVGDENFAWSVRTRIANVRRLLDVVPSLPPAVYVRKSNGTIGVPALPPMHRPGFDYVLGADYTLLPNASLLVPQLGISGWVEAIDHLIVQRHLIGNYVIQIWDTLNYDDRIANKPLYLVMRDGFGLQLSTPSSA